MTENEELTEEKIFNSAKEIFIEKGMDGARMKDIASHAGINKALLHYYYRTKEQLFNAVFENIAGKLFQKFTPVLDPSLSLEEKLRFFFREHITFLQNNPRLPLFLIYEVHRNPERIRRLVNNADLRRIYTIFYNQHKDEFDKYGINDNNLLQVMISIASMSVFPFAARGIIEALLSIYDLDFNQFIEDRKSFAAEFVLNALKNYNVKNS